MRKSNRVIHVLQTDVPPANILVSIGFSYNEIVDELKKQDCDEWLSGIKNDKEFIDKVRYCSLDRCIDDNGQLTSLLYIIFTERFLFNDSSYTILAHEVLHIVRFIMERVCHEHIEFEFEAYLHSAIMKKALEIIRK